jgi:hypothetical protein
LGPAHPSTVAPVPATTPKLPAAAEACEGPSSGPQEPAASKAASIKAASIKSIISTFQVQPRLQLHPTWPMQLTSPMCTL